MAEKDSFYFYSKSFPEILHKANASLIFTTYQAGKTIILSSKDGITLRKFARIMKRPMGLAFSKDQKKMAIAEKSEITVFGDNQNLAKSFPPSPNLFEHLYLPRVTFKTGIVDTHEMVYGGNELYFLNTLFSIISKTSDSFHFEEYWRPPFITSLSPDDKCHLNGLALRDDEPRYVTMFAKSNEPNGWRTLSANSGLLMDIKNNEILLEDLAMPHSPVYFKGLIYFLQSATGELSVYDLKSKETTSLKKFKGFVRGLEVTEEYIFVSMSKIRSSSKTFGKLPIAEAETKCGIEILERKTGKSKGNLYYTDKIAEIFGLKYLPNVNSIGILTTEDALHDKCVSINENHNYWLKPMQKKETL